MGKIWLENILFGQSFDGKEVACRRKRDVLVKILEPKAIALSPSTM
jgi:hypothetical protein